MASPPSQLVKDCTCLEQNQFKDKIKNPLKYAKTVSMLLQQLINIKEYKLDIVMNLNSVYNRKLCTNVDVDLNILFCCT